MAVSFAFHRRTACFARHTRHLPSVNEPRVTALSSSRAPIDLCSSPQGPEPLPSQRARRVRKTNRAPSHCGRICKENVNDEPFIKNSERYREGIEIIRTVAEREFPRLDTRFYGHLDGRIDLIPKPHAVRLPVLTIGRAQQTLEWIAQHVDAWIGYLGDPSKIESVVTQWRDAHGGNPAKPYGYGTFFNLERNPDAPVRIVHGVLSGGRKAIVELWKRQEEAGVSHVALNMKPLERAADQVLYELGEYVLPEFPSGLLHVQSPFLSDRHSAFR